MEREGSRGGESEALAGAGRGAVRARRDGGRNATAARSGRKRDARVGAAQAALWGLRTASAGTRWSLARA